VIYQIGVLIRTRNSDRTLEATIRSLIAQRDVALTVLVLDSGSVDRTLDIARLYGCHVERYPALLPFSYGRALNDGLARLQEDLLLVLSSHVRLGDERTLWAMADALAKYPHAVGCYSARERDPPIDDVQPVTEITLSSFNGSNGLDNACAMIRKAAWHLEAFDERLACCEDQAWALEFFRRGYCTLRLNRKPINYVNPYLTWRKLLRDRVIVARDIWPDSASWPRLGQILLQCVRSALSFRIRDAVFNLMLLLALPMNRLLFRSPTTCYNRDQWRH
jgi:glycosyltransferase involved in cell wall biosynthesis